MTTQQMIARKKRKLQGIFVGGKPLEIFLDNEKGEDLKQEIKKEQMSRTSIVKSSKSYKPKYKERKEKNGPVKKYSPQEINFEEAKRMTTTQKIREIAKHGLTYKIIETLINDMSLNEFTTTDLQKLMEDKYKTTFRIENISSRFTIIYFTCNEKLSKMTRTKKKINKKGTAKYIYTINEELKNLTPDQLYTLVTQYDRERKKKKKLLTKDKEVQPTETKDAKKELQEVRKEPISTSLTIPISVKSIEMNITMNSNEETLVKMTVNFTNEK